MCKVTTWRPYLADEFVQDDEQQSINRPHDDCVRTAGDGVRCGSASGTLLGGCGLGVVLNTS